MNFLKQIVATILLCLAFQYFLPWWTLVIGAAVAGYWAGNKGFVSFGAGFLGVALLWLVTAMIIDAQTSSILTEKVAKLFPTQSTSLLLLLTALVGGLCGGFAGLTGALVKK
jgi:hypothetical protein